MKLQLRCLNFITILLVSGCVFGQDISLYQQFNGRFDFVFIGNTLNVAENGANDPCLINTSSSASLNMNDADVVEAAYLYWAGSGPGDFNIELNGQPISPERTFSLTLSTTGLPFFSAFTDITAQVQSTGEGNYTISGLDVSPWLNVNDYCINGTNFAGWAIIVIYKNEALPLNQLNVYDGLQNVPDEINITLSSLNVIDNEDAKIGFLAWEGDAFIDVNESLRINGNIIGNPPLNPTNNAFNGTNSFTGATDLYNMDLDVYNIQDNISIGDSTAQIQLTSGQDFVMVNAIVTKLNSQLPDATITIDNVASQCNSRTIVVDYTVYNINSTDVLPAGVPIAIYADGIYFEYTETTLPIPIGGSHSQQITLLLPDEIPDVFELEFIVDNDGTGQGIVTELNETNNSHAVTVSLLSPPEFNVAPDAIACNEGFGSATFDFSDYDSLIAVNPGDTVQYFETQADAENNENAIGNTANYFAQHTPKEIFVRIQGDCYAITSFQLRARNCPPVIYNFVSVNGDGLNDTFHIVGLRDIFLNFELSVYNRWGVLVWKGNNSIPDWDGVATKGIRVGNSFIPDGTYYYVLDLNDAEYSRPFTGFLYLCH